MSSPHSEIFKSHASLECPLNSEIKQSHLEITTCVRSAALLLDMCQGLVVDKQHAGQVGGRAQALNQRLHFLDARWVASVAQGLNHSGDGERHGYVVGVQQRLQRLKSLCGGVQEAEFVCMKWVYVCVHLRCLFLTSGLAFLALCDDEQTGGDITQLEAWHTRRSTKRDGDETFSWFVNACKQTYCYLCQSVKNNLLHQCFDSRLYKNEQQKNGSRVKVANMMIYTMR